MDGPTDRLLWICFLQLKSFNNGFKLALLTDRSADGQSGLLNRVNVSKNAFKENFNSVINQQRLIESCVHN